MVDPQHARYEDAQSLWLEGDCDRPQSDRGREYKKRRDLNSKVSSNAHGVKENTSAMACREVTVGEVQM